jgi:hypothetical protein
MAATAIGALTAGVVMVLSMATGGTGINARPATTTQTLVLAAGLLVYVAGLFAPLSIRSRS